MSEAGSTLCVACGLCCDGNLFTQVPLGGEEVARARSQGLVVFQRDDGGMALRQRCTALVDRCCEVYAARPDACKRYRCMLLTALAEGEVAVEEALIIVARAQALLVAVEEALHEGGPAAPLQRARKALRDGTAGPGLQAAIAAARAWLGRHFQRDVLA